MIRNVVFFLLAVVGTSVLAAETPPAETKKPAEKKVVTKKAAPAKAPVIRPGDIKLSGKSASTAPAKSSDSPLVQAAKSGSDGRGKSKLSITDKDVKSSTGKLSIISTRTGYDPSAAPLVTTPPVNTEAAAAEAKKAHDAAQVRLEKAQKDVADLEKELAQLEDDYYSEDNIDFRDNVLEERFDKTKKQLDRARAELSNARDEAQKYQ